MLNAWMFQNMQQQALLRGSKSSFPAESSAVLGPRLSVNRRLGWLWAPSAWGLTSSIFRFLWDLLFPSSGSRGVVIMRPHPPTTDMVGLWRWVAVSHASPPNMAPCLETCVRLHIGGLHLRRKPSRGGRWRPWNHCIQRCLRSPAGFPCRREQHWLFLSPQVQVGIL